MKPGVALVLSQRPDVKYVPAFMKGMPKEDNLIVPHNSTLVYGRPTIIQSTDVQEIMNQIEKDFIFTKR